MLFRRGVRRPSQNEIKELQRLREFALKASEVLRQFHMPDTFLGRKTQEPFPRQAQHLGKTGSDYPS